MSAFIERWRRLVEADPTGTALIDETGSTWSRRDLQQRVIVSSIDSIYSKTNELLRHGRIDRVIVDEAHRLPKHHKSRYQTFIRDLRRANPDLFEEIKAGVLAKRAPKQSDEESSKPVALKATTAPAKKSAAPPVAKRKRA